MSENTTNEPPKDHSPLQANKALARQILKTLGQEYLGNYEAYLEIQPKIIKPIRRTFSKTPDSQGQSQSPIHNIPDPTEARRLLQTAWIGTQAHDGENGDIVNFRLHVLGGIITRSTKTEARDQRGHETVTYAANTQGTEKLIEQLIIDLGFEDPGRIQTINETMRSLRRTNTLTLTNWKTPDLQMTVTRPPNIKPEVTKPIDAAYRIQVQRTIPTTTGTNV